MGKVIPFRPSTSTEDDWNILSVKHRNLLKTRLEGLIKSIDDQQIAHLQSELPKKLQQIHGHKEFTVKLVKRTQLLHEILSKPELNTSHRFKQISGAALLYLVTPQDFISDNVPGLGFLDDAFVLELVFQNLQAEISSLLNELGYAPDGYF